MWGYPEGAAPPPYPQGFGPPGQAMGGHPGAQWPPGPPGQAMGGRPGGFRGQQQVTLSWVPAIGGQVPPNAVQAGNGIFVARARFNGEIIPGKAARGHQCAYIPHGGREHSVRDYEILCDTHINCFGCNFEWQRCHGGNIPPNALIGGHTVDQQPLYIGRGAVSGEAVAGKVQQAHGCAYFPWGGQEHAVQQFEILVLKS